MHRRKPCAHAAISGVGDEDMVLDPSIVAAAGEHATAETDIIKILFVDVYVGAASATEKASNFLRCFIACGMSVDFEGLVFLG